MKPQPASYRLGSVAIRAARIELVIRKRVSHVHKYVNCYRIAATLAACAALCGTALQGVAQAKVDQPPAASSSSVQTIGKIPPDDAKVVPPGTSSSANAWRDKQIPDWTEADAKQILADSPWAKSVTATSDKPLSNTPAKPGRGSHRGGFGLGGFGFGRHSAPSDASNSNNSSTSSSSSSTSSSSSSSSSAPGTPPALPTLKLRWESALPIREAELKARDTGALAVDENHYAIAVYGLPSKFVKDDSKKFAQQLKAQAFIKRDAKTDIKPSSVEIRMREDGPVILYLFPRTEEITWRDHQLVFDAQIGHLKVKQTFQSDDMRFHGTLDL